MKQYLPYYRHLLTVKWPFLAGVASGLLYALASGAGLPLMTKVVFPVLFNAGGAEGKPYEIWMRGMLGGISRDHLLLVTCLWIPLIFLLRGISGYANSYLIQYSGLRVLEEIRIDLFVKLQGLPLSFFKNNRSGDLLSRLMNDTGILRQVIAQASSDLIKQPATLLSALGVLVYLALKDHSFFIALISLITVPVCVTLIRYAGKRLTGKARKLQARSGDLTATLTESLQSPLEIRAYNLENRQISNFRKRISELVMLSMKVVKYRQAISPSIEVVAATGFAAALFFGVRSGMTLEGFMTLGMALFMSYEPIKKLGAIHSQFRQGEAAIERLDYILKQPDSLPDPASPEPFTTPQRSIRFENLTFAYQEEPVLRNVDLDIPIGTVVALVGPSGAGKSTFASLIPRFYDPQSGGISIDGTDLRAFSKTDLRRHIAVVPQMPSLFAGTISENIRIGRYDATEAEILEAARKAHADEFIRTLPGGYQTEVGERGDQLSGGQRQRIAIARAFLRDAPILILDEATSALDSESEAMVQQALAELVKGRTTFIIAHRFSTISIADRILVFEAGRIVADGSHEQLRETCPIYQAMQSGQLPI
ncbi:MAG: ABC transporter ATP-binding protein [Luteolibacter sp.]|nr:ABC transporter ATP-binding protein [Luteolibacter sp.]